jgi:hypothetical protein
MTLENGWSPYSSHFEELESKAERNISATTTECMEQCDNTIHNLIEGEHVQGVAATKMISKRLFLQEHDLASRCGIGLKDAENTVKVTTQKLIRSAVHPIERRF